MTDRLATTRTDGRTTGSGRKAHWVGGRSGERSEKQVMFSDTMRRTSGFLGNVWWNISAFLQSSKRIEVLKGCVTRGKGILRLLWFRLPAARATWMERRDPTWSNLFKLDWWISYPCDRLLDRHVLDPEIVGFNAIRGKYSHWIDLSLVIWRIPRT